MKWTVAVIAAARGNGEYLETTLRSIIGAGWDNPIVFCEPKTIIPKWFNGDVVERRKQFGDWSNWATGAFDVLLTEPDSDYFLMSEDDCAYCKGIRSYLENTITKLGNFGSLSLFTPSIYCKKQPFKGFHNENRGKNTWSTLTVIMSKNNLIEFFSDQEVQRHRFSDLFEVGLNPEGTKFSFGRGKTSVIDCVGNTIKDAVIGHWAEKKGLPIYFHTPSLTQHIGQVSTLTDDIATVANGRQAADYVGDDCDISDWGKGDINITRRLKAPLL